MIYTAFILGLISSLHCVGMCGPLAMALPFQGVKNSRFTGTLLYNLGRVTTYASFGLVFGLIGKSFSWFGWQQYISIGLGLVIFIAILLSRFAGNSNMLARTGNVLMLRVRGALGKLLFHGHPASFYGIGLLNGLLPCGMVYLALAGATATGNPAEGAFFMMLFGLGTLPAMWSVVFFGSMIGQPLRSAARKLYPAMMMIVAMLLIIRGLNLGIPYLSPRLTVSSSVSADCHR